MRAARGSERREVQKARYRVNKRISGKKECASLHWTAQERVRRQNLAVVLRAAGYSYPSIAASVGVQQTTVKNWFNIDKRVRELYDDLMIDVAQNGRMLLAAIALKSMEVLYEILEEETDNKIRLDAAKEGLDRGGYPKESRKENVSHVTAEQKTTFGALPEVAALRELPVDKQEEAAQLIERLEEMLNGAPENS
jgi:hypothetical protein